MGAGVSAVVEYSHQKSYKVIIQGHVTKKGDLTKNFDQVCVWDDWIGYIPESMNNGCWRVASGDICHRGHLRPQLRVICGDKIRSLPKVMS